MEPLCLGKPSDPGSSGKDNRLFVEAVLWVARTGSTMSDDPDFEYLIVDSTIVRAHQHAAGAKNV
jgi:putative transposase